MKPSDVLAIGLRALDNERFADTENEVREARQDAIFAFQTLTNYLRDDGRIFHWRDAIGTIPLVTPKATE